MSPTELARAVREASHGLALADGARRSAALTRLAERLLLDRDAILSANEADLADAATLAPALRSRLALSAAKLEQLRQGLLELAASPDPVGRVLSRTRLDEGLELEKVTHPLGVALVIFESRPDAVIQISGLAIRAGTGAILKGGSEAARSNAALVACVQAALVDVGLAQAVAGLEGRAAVAELLGCDSLIDLVIPRGSGAMVKAIAAATRIPVLGHAEGVCHLYLDAAADPARALHLALDGKTDYPSACNATEALLVHRDFLPRLPVIGAALQARGVALRADLEAQPWLSGAVPATDADRGHEYGELTLAVFTVASLDEALAFIRRYGSAHTDAICTEDPAAAARFLAEVDSASVFHNASTRFADGYRYGLGAELGISTARVHARGPVGVEGLLTTRWLLRGQGQGAGDYGPGRRAFLHERLPTDS